MFKTNDEKCAGLVFQKLAGLLRGRGEVMVVSGEDHLENMCVCVCGTADLTGVIRPPGFTTAFSLSNARLFVYVCAYERAGEREIVSH